MVSTLLSLVALGDSYTYIISIMLDAVVQSAKNNSDIEVLEHKIEGIADVLKGYARVVYHVGLPVPVPLCVLSSDNIMMQTPPSSPNNGSTSTTY